MALGLIFCALSIPPLLIEISLPLVLMAVGGVGMLITAGYDLLFSDDPSGPTQPNAQFFVVVLRLLLSVAGFAVTILS